MFVRLCAAAMSVLLLASATPSSAAVMVATYSGMTGHGWDWSGYFGSEPGDVDPINEAFVATFKFDTDRGVLSVKPGETSVFGDHFDVTGQLGPLISAEITINGKSLVLLPEAQSRFTNNGSGADHSAILRTPGKLGSSSLWLHWYATDIPRALDAPYAPSGGNGLGEVYYDDPTLGHSLQISLIPTSLQVTTAVPEPATWAIMLIGFGVVGGALRHARTSGRLRDLIA